MPSEKSVPAFKKSWTSDRFRLISPVDEVRMSFLADIKGQIFTANGRRNPLTYVVPVCSVAAGRAPGT